jgi:hypothetical protein
MITGRLLKESHRPAVQRTFLIVSRSPGGEYDDWDCRETCHFSHSFKDQEPIISGHSKIEDDEIWPLLARQSYAGSAILSADHFIAAAFQSGGQAEQEMSIVVDNQNGLSGHLSFF